MKKIRIFSLLVVAMFILSSFAVGAAYSLDDYPFDAERENIKVLLKANQGSPSVDGSISDGEGWGDVVTFDHKNLLQFWASSSRCIISADVRMAWDDTGLYISADITDPTMIPVTGEDGTGVDDDNGTNDYGWNGDVFVFALDPQGKFLEEGFVTTDWRSAWYCFGIDANGKVKCYVTQSTYTGDITSRIDINGTLNSDGWTFEAKLPWDRLNQDTEAVTDYEISLDKDAFTQLGTKSRAGITYVDRAEFNTENSIFSNTEYAEGTIFTLSRSISVPTIHDDGMNYNSGTPAAYSYGIDLTIADETGYAPEVVVEPDEPDEPDTPDTPDESGDSDETNEPAETNKTPSGSKPGKDTEKPLKFSDESTATTGFNADSMDNVGGGNGVPTGLIIGIIAGVVVVAAAVVVIIVVKKKKAN